jgi:hypothetical protein
VQARVDELVALAPPLTREAEHAIRALAHSPQAPAKPQAA